jgi:PhnB protein
LAPTWREPNSPCVEKGWCCPLLGTEAPSLMRQWFSKLSEGGRVLENLQRRPWGASEGQVADRHGLRQLIGFEGDDGE